MAATSVRCIKGEDNCLIILTVWKYDTDHEAEVVSTCRTIGVIRGSVSGKKSNFIHHVFFVHTMDYVEAEVRYQGTPVALMRYHGGPIKLEALDDAKRKRFAVFPVRQHEGA